jgi:hypothetical protein
MGGNETRCHRNWLYIGRFIYVSQTDCIGRFIYVSQTDCYTGRFMYVSQTTIW